MNAFDAPRALQRPSLRPYQLQAVEAVCKSLETNDTTLLVMCTGGGKTQIASSIAERFLDKGKILFLAHRKELVQQGADRLHLVTGEQVDIEMAELWASNRSKVVSASLDSMRTRLERWAPDHFSLVIFDECFPAGTLVDGRPIETIRLGDEVQSVDHSDGMVKPRSVVRIFKKLCSSMYRLSYGASEVTCTGNHPVFVKGRGYVEAKHLVPGDLLCLRLHMGVHGGDLSTDKKDLLSRVPSEALIGDYGAHEQGSRFGSNEGQQSDAQGWGSGETERHLAGHGSQATDSWWERARRDASGEGYSRSAGLAYERHREDRLRAQFGLPYQLQDRRGEPRTEGGHRGGRAEPSSSSSTGSGQEEGGLLTWVRLDNLESVEPSSPGGDWVYNLEVEGSHTYFANDLLVHNCHHSIAKSYRKVLDHFQCKKMGMTATPDRGDEKALGQVWGDVAFVYDIVQGIEDGYLVPIKGQSVRVDEVNLSNISKTAGDLAVGELDEEIASHIEGIVSKTLEIAPNRTGIWFFPGVKSAELACDRLNALGHTAAFVCGETPKEERDDIMKGFKNGTYRHLTNCQVATEGFDAPNADMVVIGRPTLSRALYAQMVGRGLRVLPGLVDGVDDGQERKNLVRGSRKPYCAVVDFAGNAGKHTLVTPEDLLGGDYTEEEVKLAKKAAKEGCDGDVLEGLEAARRELKAMMAKLQSKVKATVTEFSPFRVLAMAEPDPSKEKFREPMTDGQIARLKGFNLKDAQLRGLSKLEAQKLLGGLETRRKLGLASLNQMNVLQRHCKPPTNLPFKQASKAMTFLTENCAWNPSAEQKVALQEMVAKR